MRRGGSSDGHPNCLNSAPFNNSVQLYMGCVSVSACSARAYGTYQRLGVGRWENLWTGRARFTTDFFWFPLYLSGGPGPIRRAHKATLGNISLDVFLNMLLAEI